ncbi:MAG TPA: hypothetical protein VE547_08805 [Mycobacteriales bacterium]|jgi:hypothetical protein|nr:hypothetical protein [Mycobacteriales bacterium]
MQPGYDPLARVATLDRFFVQQQFAPIANIYRISAVGPDGNPAEPVAYVRQKRMKIREQIDFYTDESQSVPLMRLQARKVFEFRGMTDVLLPDGGQVIGSVKKNFARSLLRSSWSVLDPAGREVATARERSMFFAVLRRAWALIPFVGDIPYFIPFHFEIHGPDGRLLGTYVRRWALRDRYLMDLSGDPQRWLDRRVMMAFTVALDALQDR